MTLVNVTSYLREEAMRGERLIAADAHPTVLGQARIAEAIIRSVGLGTRM